MRSAFEQEIEKARERFEDREFDECFRHLERAHILGQRQYWPHVQVHWWMLRVGWQRADAREVLGQLLRVIGSVGSLIGWVPIGNTGGANVRPYRPMPIPEDLAVYFQNRDVISSGRRRWWIAGGLFSIALLTAAGWQWRHQQGVTAADELWLSTEVQRLTDFGSTKRLSILPLVNWHTGDDHLLTEAGVSYLVRTDHHTLLFDLGFNRQQQSPSPLEHNMLRLGISLDVIDSIFLSHHHLDHVGGLSWVRRNSFSLGNRQVDLSNKRVLAPIPLVYPGVEVTFIEQPAAIGSGLASIGPIRRQLAMGRIDEQALAIHVANKGIVLLVGCGHQTLERIIERARKLFDLPIYGVVGDLHYPLPQGRLEMLGINLQHRMASGSGPLVPMTPAEIEADLLLLAGMNLGVVALGGHDTSDEVIARAQQLFGQHYHQVRVGDWIEVSS